MIRCDTSILVDLAEHVFGDSEFDKRVGVKRVGRGGIVTDVQRVEHTTRVTYCCLVVLERKRGEGHVDEGTRLGVRHYHQSLRATAYFIRPIVLFFSEEGHTGTFEAEETVVSPVTHRKGSLVLQILATGLDEIRTAVAFQQKAEVIIGIAVAPEVAPRPCIVESRFVPSWTLTLTPVDDLRIDDETYFRGSGTFLPVEGYLVGVVVAIGFEEVLGGIPGFRSEDGDGNGEG